MNEEILKVKQRGIINWGKPISTILEEGDNLIKLIKFGENTELLSVLFEGERMILIIYPIEWTIISAVLRIFIRCLTFCCRSPWEWKNSSGCYLGDKVRVSVP